MKQILGVPQQVGPVIRAARKNAGLSQTALARRLGISQSRMSAIELDPRSLTLDKFMALISLLGLELQVQSPPPLSEITPGGKVPW
jgi:HTH-type transcriptional regulator/antitoxin HipB